MTDVPSAHMTSAVPVVRTVVESPVGRLELRASDTALTMLAFGEVSERRATSRRDDGTAGKALPDEPENHVLAAAAEQLTEYFAGVRQQFDLPLSPRGTPFQLEAWQALRTIPYGATISYGEQARRVGDARKARAVGAANGRNPIAIIVPCHRVIGADGSLTGFGGGVDVKSWLLDHERRVLAAAPA